MGFQGSWASWEDLAHHIIIAPPFPQLETRLEVMNPKPK